MRKIGHQIGDQAKTLNKVGEKDNAYQKALVSIFGLCAFLLSFIVFYLFRKRYEEAVGSHTDIYTCKNNVQESWILAMRWNFIFYLILCCISAISVLAGPITVIRPWNGCVSGMASIAHLVMVIWTAKKRFDNDGDMCMITAP